MTLNHETLWDKKIDNDNFHGSGGEKNENKEEEEKEGIKED